MYVFFRDSCGGGECDVKPVTPERDSFVRISVTDADDHTTQQISESRTLSLHSLGGASAHQQTVCRKKKVCCTWLDYLDLRQQLPGGQPFQQRDVTMQFKMTSNMADAVLILHILEQIRPKYEVSRSLFQENTKFCIVLVLTDVSSFV